MKHCLLLIVTLLIIFKCINNGATSSIPSFINTARANGGDYPLHLAVPYVDVVLQLLHHGANVNVTNDHGDTPLHSAVKGRNYESVLLLIDHGADVNRKNKYGHTPFSNFKYDDSKICDLFVDNKLKLEVEDNIGDNTELFFTAVRGGHKMCIKHLINVGANVNAKTWDGITPLHLALMIEPVCVQCTEELLLAGANHNATDANGMTPLHLALTATVPLCVRCIQNLLDAGANVNAQDFSERTPLHLAVNSTCQGYCVSALLDKGAETESKDIKGFTPLMTAVQLGKYEIAITLLKYSAKIVTPMNGTTLLHISLDNKDTEMAHLLIPFEKGEPEWLKQWHPMHFFLPPPSTK